MARRQTNADRTPERVVVVRGGNASAAAALTFAILGALGLLIPFLGWCVSPVFLLLAFCLGLDGLLTARKRGGAGTGASVAALIISGIAVIPAAIIIVSASLLIFGSEVIESASESRNTTPQSSARTIPSAAVAHKGEAAGVGEFEVSSLQAAENRFIQTADAEHLFKQIAAATVQQLDDAVRAFRSAGVDDFLTSATVLEGSISEIDSEYRTAYGDLTWPVSEFGYVSKNANAKIIQCIAVLKLAAKQYTLVGEAGSPMNAVEEFEQARNALVGARRLISELRDELGDAGRGAKPLVKSNARPGRSWYAKHDNLVVRESANSSASPIVRVDLGHELIEISRIDGWVEVGVVRTGKTGWVPASSTTLTRTSGTPRTSESDEFRRFKSAFSTLNQSVKSQTGIELFSDAEDMGDGIIHVTATRDWLSATLDEQSSSLTTVYNLWRAAERSNLPIAVYVRDTRGNIVMKKSSP